jgi:hypothetical protein
MPEVSEDGTVLTFTLRPDVKFHNGRVITAEDFKYSWDRWSIRTEVLGRQHLSNVVGYEDGGSRRRDPRASRSSTRHHDRLTLEQPDFTILNAMSRTITAPVPARRSSGSAKRSSARRRSVSAVMIEGYDAANQRAVRSERGSCRPPVHRRSNTVGGGLSTQMLQLQNGTATSGDGVPSIGRATSPTLS